jgi:EmrB/QacA subfamily drug resistance transporter
MDNRKRNLVLLVLFLGVLMGALDIAIVGPALPAIQKQFSEVDARMLTWMFSIFVLFNLIGTPLMSKLSDIYGRRSIYILDVALFAVGSLVVALAPSYWVVLLGRGIQGFGAGGIFPVASAVIGDTFPPEKRGGALGLIGAVFGLAFIIGPVIGGIILTVASWHWLFLINLPIAAVVIIMSWRVLPNDRKNVESSFDGLGMLVLSVMLACLAIGIGQIDTKIFFPSLVSVKVLPFILAAVALFFILVQIEKRADYPILKPTLFQTRQLRLAYLLAAGAGLGEASLVYMPLLAISSLGSIKESQASYLLMPVVLAMAFGSPLSGRMLDKVGSKIVILSGTIVLTVGLILLSQFPGYLALFILAGILIGLGLSALLGAPIRYILLNEVAVNERTIAQGVMVIFGSIGQLVGSALVASVSHSLGGGIAGYSTAFLVISGISVFMIAAAMGLKVRSEELSSLEQQAVQV